MPALTGGYSFAVYGLLSLKRPLNIARITTAASLLPGFKLLCRPPIEWYGMRVFRFFVVIVFWLLQAGMAYAQVSFVATTSASKIAKNDMLEVTY